VGRKVNPIGFRLGINRTWESKWFAERGYTEQLHQDLLIRRAVMKELSNAGVAQIDIERAANKIDVTIHTAKPGIVIGKGGQNVDRLKGVIERVIGGDKNKRVHLRIEEIKQPEVNARLVAESIAEQIGRRVAYRRAAKQAVQRAERLGAKGVRVRLSGRLGGAEMSRVFTEMTGRVPLHTLRANIDYGMVHAHTTYGRIGVKVWIYRGDVLPERESARPPRPAPPETTTAAD
jgi:small subunit ribosomal protein S3